MNTMLLGVKISQITQKLSSYKFQLQMQSIRSFAGWNKDYKPSSYPLTNKEIVSSAKKYNLLPEEYRPYADDGLGYGDYPKVGYGLGVEAKDSYYPYDYPEHKRNFNEPISTNHDLYSEDRFSQPDHPRLSNTQYWLSFLGVMTTFFVVYYWLDNKKMYRPVSMKQYPAEGIKHYTFDQ